jgi:4-hydroxy-tetrahydrodipicolinate reductase
MNVVITGAAGRMGRALMEAVSKTSLTISGLLEREGAAQGKISDSPDVALKGANVVIDFTIPHATLALLEKCVAQNIAMVIGTTGFTQEEETKILEASKRISIVKSGNMSLGVNILATLVEQAAAKLAEFDIEILEMHHNKKVDAPSGTALLLGEAAAKGRNVALAEKSVRVRDGHTGAREKSTIGFATLRGGTVIGDHDVIFAGQSERLILSHRAESREMFATGAVKAAEWLEGKPAGLYSMRDVLGL